MAFFELPELPEALAILLLRSPDYHVRRQASLFVQDLRLEAPEAGGLLLTQLRHLLPVAVQHAAYSGEYWDLCATLLRTTKALDEEALTEALLALALRSAEEERGPLGGRGP